jgi:hypothetical protein
MDGEVMSSIKFAPVVSGPGCSGLVADCPDHALPFGILFEEYAARRGADLEQYVKEVFKIRPESDWINEVNSRLTERNDKYRKLAALKVSPDALPSQIDDLERDCQELDKPFKRVLHKMNSSALCLSGGGIRSASFGLGVLESLARFSLGLLHPAQTPKGNATSSPAGLVHKLDYLSTVSGGGYIGSWLTAWVYRRRTAGVEGAEIKGAEAELAVRTTELKQAEADFTKARAKAPTLKPSNATTAATAPRSSTAQGAATVEGPVKVARERLEKAKAARVEARNRVDQANAASWNTSYSQVVRALAGGGDFTSGDPAPQPVRHLREYTSYLAPAMGLSLDSWDLVTIVFRNLFINWVMLTPLLLAVVSLPQVSYYVTRDIKSYSNSCRSLLMLLLVLVLFVIAAIFCGCRLPSHRRFMNRGPSAGLVALGFAAPVLLANWIIAELWYANQGIDLTTRWRWYYWAVFLISCVGFATLAMLLFLSYRRRVVLSSRPNLVHGAQGALRFLLMQVAALVSAFVTTELLVLLALHVFPQLVKTHAVRYGLTPDERLYTILALPLITLVPLVSHSLFSGLLGIFEQEEDREWMSRVGGLQLALITVWVVAHAVALYAAEGLTAILSIALSGAVLGGTGSALGWSGSTSAGPRPVKAAQISKLGSFLNKHDLLLPSLSAVALLLLTMGAAGAEHTLAKHALAGGKPAGLESHLIILGASVVLALLANWAINVNLFSLHGMYRMRLMRAFLGASNTRRYPDSFTQFDPKDTPREVEVAHGSGMPLHVINTTLNLVGTQNLAWRQRKAASFTFSSLHSGSWRLAYVPTEAYAGADGVTLATAMAISGAAFNPNMGYHSSPLVTLLMTFFNVRLGWWLPNPAREGGAYHFPVSAKSAYFLHKTGPTIALEPLILEAFGMTDDTYRWIELTDGAHFENFGLYEMVLRRCHNIVVVDAGADPDCQFEDLGNALRKIQIDLGIPIRFNDGIKMKAGAKPDNRYCAVATIDYGCVDDDATLPGDERSKLAGTLIYIKAALTGDEPPDIKQYALTHATFPHETTANQFFNESQFESYRHLGSYELETIVKEGPPKATVRLNGQDLLTSESSAEIPLGVDFESFAMVARAYVSALPSQLPASQGSAN